MSLTNPRSVVTEQRLSAFYQGILPYMGGMPEMLANKFSKGDIFSTEEKMIGQWIDGKPLYQKSFTITLSSTQALSSGVNTNLFYGTKDISSIVQNIDNCIVLADKSYWTLDNSIRGFVACWYENPATIFVMTLYSRTNVEGHFTIQYTKTTDSAISIGDDTDYSTEEKIIGTWIDGKPIYQKTIDFGKGPNNAEKSVPHGISNLDKTVNISGVYVEGQYSDPLPNAPIDSTGKIYSTNVYVDGTNLHVRSTYDFSNRDFYITLQYTKTT